MPTYITIYITMKKLVLTIIFLALSTTSFAAKNHQSDYLGEEDRELKSLSQKDINALRSGAGWGLAKPAELNGVPGPAHILELQKELELADEQKQKIQAIWSSMNKKAVAEGKKYLASEEKIERFFQLKKKDHSELGRLLDQSSQHLSMLRKIHLSAHLEALPILTPHQIKKYNVLRGYQKHSHHGH